MDRLHLDQAVIVEGKYDKIKLETVLDAEIICTDGFGIFKNSEKLMLIRRIAEKNGIIIMTDSDSAGFVIRSHLMGTIPNKYITNVYIPELIGKEKRKSAPSKEGLLGVEGVSSETIKTALEKAGVFTDNCVKQDKITVADLYKAGLSGSTNSRKRRNDLLKSLSLPSGISTGQMLTALNALYSKSEFSEIILKGNDS